MSTRGRSSRIVNTTGTNTGIKSSMKTLCQKAVIPISPMPLRGCIAIWFTGSARRTQLIQQFPVLAEKLSSDVGPDGSMPITGIEKGPEPALQVFVLTRHLPPAV